jgi:hypothetical protein
MHQTKEIFCVAAMLLLCASVNVGRKTAGV